MQVIKWYIVFAEVIYFFTHEIRVNDSIQLLVCMFTWVNMKILGNIWAPVPCISTRNKFVLGNIRYCANKRLSKSVNECQCMVYVLSRRLFKVLAKVLGN